MTPLMIGVDVGGTKVAAGLVSSDGALTQRVEVPSEPAAADSMLRCIATAVGLVREAVEPGQHIVGVGVAAAGYIGSDQLTVLFSPNIAWRHEPLGVRLADLCGLPVAVENDANAAAWAEFCVGAGRHVNDMTMVTVGTGLGGGVIIDGRLLRGAHGVAAEIGHLTFDPAGARCGCGRFGCAETYVSGPALAALGQQFVTDNPDLAGPMLTGDAQDCASPVTGRSLSRAAMHSDPLACNVFEVFGGRLGRVLADLSAVFDPAMFVVGGGVAEVGEVLLGPARASLAEHMTGGAEFHPVPEVVLAALGNDAGIVGAGLLAAEALDGA